MASDSVAGRLVTGLGRRGLTLILAGMLVALSMGIAPSAQATPNLAKAWGSNTFGQLGDGTATGPEQCGVEQSACSTVPVAVSGLSGVVALSGGGSTLSTHFSLALLEGGTVAAWGANGEGQLGDGSITPSTVPVAVSGLGGVTAISSGEEHGLALLGNGTVMAWGKDTQGQLGTGTQTSTDVPVPVCAVGTPEEKERIEKHEAPGCPEGPYLTGVVGIAAGAKHSLAILSNGTVVAWGNNNRGQLGDGSVENKTVPVAVSGVGSAVSVSGGERHSLALLRDGTVMAWGANNFGQLGNGSETNSTSPVPVAGLTNVSAIAAGGNHNLALLGGGTIKAWGENGHGELGIGTSAGPEACVSEASPCSKTPVTVIGLSGVRAISAGGVHSIALLAGGSVKDWGANGSGQLGDGTSAGPEACAPSGSCSTSPVEVSKLQDVVGIAGGGQHTLAFGPPPAVTKVTPKTGPASGEAYVGITGTDFTGATGVKFGSANATSIEVISPTFMFAKTPAGMTVGIVDVTVTNTWGTSAPSSADLYTVKPTVTGVSPNTGPTAGGTSVTVKGSGFIAGATGTSITFGGRKATSVKCASTTECTAVSPKHLAGTFDVKVTVNGVRSPRNRPADQFTYS